MESSETGHTLKDSKLKKKTNSEEVGVGSEDIEQSLPLMVCKLGGRKTEREKFDMMMAMWVWKACWC